MASLAGATLRERLTAHASDFIVAAEPRRAPRRANRPDSIGIAACPEALAGIPAGPRRSASRDLGPGKLQGMTEGRMDLTAAETRVLGCLLEKQRTTPDMYPLTLNGLRLACNQSTNRDPVVDYDDGVIREALHRLERRGFARLASGRGSRAPKYRHLLADALPMGEDEQATMCVLMLRGSQTPGELKQRTERMHAFATLDDVNETLGRLDDRGLVERLDRRPGQKEERYVQLLEERASADGVGAGELGSAAALADGEPRPAHSAPIDARRDAIDDASLGALLERVSRLEREVAELRAGVERRRDPVSTGEPLPAVHE